MTEDSSNFNQDEFEMALQESFGGETISVGSIIEGNIVAIHGDAVLVEVGGKSEAVLERSELDELGTGDPVEVVVVSMGEEVRVSRRLALEHRLTEQLGRAAEDGSALDGKVVGRRKGGFDINVSGVRGFCPVSQIDDTRSDDLDRHLGETYKFKIIEYDPDERKLVVSRAAHLREEKARLRAEAWERLEAGSVVEGKVRSLTDFGAFIDLGGVDGLVHVTEISHRRVGHARDVFAVGDQVKVKILELDEKKNRISLSIKQLEPDPWEKVTENYAAKGPFEGTVVRKAGFGVFVELQPGLDGLLHVSQLPPGMELNSIEVDQPLRGWIRELDVANRRIGLTLRQVPDHDPWKQIDLRYQEGQVVDGVVENGADFGVFVELEPGVSALIPTSELGMGRDVDPKKAFAPGEQMKVKVLSVDGSRQRISLSIRAYKQDQERSEYLEHMDTGTEDKPTVTGFGAQLQAALGKKK